MLGVCEVCVLECGGSKDDSVALFNDFDTGVDGEVEELVEIVEEEEDVDVAVIESFDDKSFEAKVESFSLIFDAVLLKLNERFEPKAETNFPLLDFKDSSSLLVIFNIQSMKILTLVKSIASVPFSL